MLSTIGYEGAEARDLMRTLIQANVQLLIDVRERAQSRKPGFSKSALREALDREGIGYIHYRELGDPKEGRLAARSGNYQLFHRIFAQVLESKSAEVALTEIANACQAQSVCLLCFERDPSHCHRTMVADKIQEMTGLKARHLGVRALEQTRESARQMPDPC